MENTYDIGKEYLVIMKQTIQTAIPQTINRIEIGEVIGETDKCLILKTRYCHKRRLRKSMITKMFDFSEHLSVIYFVDKLEGVLA